MRKWTNFILKHPVKIIVILITISVFFALQIPDIKVETGLEDQLPPDIPEVQFLEEVNEVFPETRDYALITLMMPEGEHVFQKEALERIYNLSQGASKLPGVVEVMSITHFQELVYTGFAISTRKLYDPEDIYADTIEGFRQEVEADPVLSRGFLGANGQGTMIMIVADREKADLGESFVRKLEALVEETDGPGEAFTGGKIVIDTLVGEIIMDDLMRLLGYVVLAIILILFLSFGTFWSVVLPLLTVFLSAVWTVGIMAIFQIPISLSTVITPVLLSAVGTAYCIHIINKYYEELLETTDRRALIHKCTSSVGFAVFMSGVTTFAGFMSLGISRILPVRTLGLVAGLGVAIVLFFALTLLPAMLAILSLRKKSRGIYFFNNLISKFLSSIGNIISRKKWVVGVFLAILAAIAIMGMPQLTTDADHIGTLPQEHPLRRSFDLLNDHFIGTTQLQLVIQGEPGDLARLETLEGLEKMEQKLNKEDNIGLVQSSNLYIKMINQAISGGDPEYFRLPDDQEELDFFLAVLEMGGLEEIERYITPDYSGANVIIYLQLLNARGVRDTMNKIDVWAQEHLPEDVEYSLTGMGYLFLVINDLLVQGQIKSLILSLVLVFAIVSLLLRSLAKGLFSLLALSSAILMNFGIMGWFGIPLDLATVTIASIAVGIGVDYSIHFLNRLKEELKTFTLERAITRTILTAGKAILINALAVMLGFLVLIFSTFQTLSHIGILVAITMFTSSVGALTILPFALLYIRPSFSRKGE